MKFPAAKVVSRRCVFRTDTVSFLGEASGREAAFAVSVAIRVGSGAGLFAGEWQLMAVSRIKGSQCDTKDCWIFVKGMVIVLILKNGVIRPV